MQKVVQISYNRWQKIEATLERIDRPEMITEKEAAALLGWKWSSYQTKKATIPADFYRTNALGKRFYFKDKILGLSR